MPISFGRKRRFQAEIDVLAVPLQPDSRLLLEPRARLIDLRSPESFQKGFIPGSLNVPDAVCAATARRMGLFKGRQVYLLADEIEQLEVYSIMPGGSASTQSGTSVRAEVVGWFGQDAIEEWYWSQRKIGSWQPVTRKLLCSEEGRDRYLVVEVCEEGFQSVLSDPSTLRFTLSELPAALSGLPLETELCVTASTDGLASFGASLLWGAGFHCLATLEGAGGWW